MRLLLDTHVWLWMLSEPDRLGKKVRARLADRRDDVFLSAASAWELAIKSGAGRIPLPEPVDTFVATRLLRDGIKPLPVEIHHATAVAALPQHHSDPFDRLLVAQAQAEQMTLVTADAKLRAYDVRILRA